MRFDDELKKFIEQFDAPYQPGDWEGMEKKLNNRGKTSVSKWWLLIPAAGVLALLSYPFMKEEKSCLTKPVCTSKTQEESVSVETTETTITNEAAAEDLKNSNRASISTEQTTADSKQNSIATTTEIKKAEVAESKKQVSQEASADQTPKESNSAPVKERKQNSEALPTVAKNKACVNEAISFTVENPLKNISYVWSMGDGKTITGNNFRYAYKNSGRYSVGMIAYEGRTELYSKNISEEVEISDTPESDFSYSQPNISNYDPTFVFEANTNGNENLFWELPGKNKQKGKLASCMMDKKGSHEVMLISQNAEGCKDTAIKVVEISEDYNLFAPNSFSPNGDGLNDTWFPKALEFSDNLQFTLTIMDANTGNVLYTAKDSKQAWDGVKQNNREMARGGEKMVWVAVVKYADGNSKKFGGAIVVSE